MPLAPRMPRDVRAISMRLPRVVELADRHVLGAQAALVLHAAQVVGEQRALLDLERHVGELLLRQLERADRLAELHALLRVVRARDSKHARAAPITPQMMPNRASFRHDSGPLSPSTPGSTAPAGSRTSSITSSRRHARAQRHLLVDVGRAEPRSVARHHEPAHAVVGVRPHDRDVAHAAVRDPHLRAVEHPVVAVAPGERAHRARGRCRSRARSGRSTRSPRRSSGAAATRRAARRCRTSGWRTSRARSSPRRTSAGRSRPLPARARRARTPRRSSPSMPSPFSCMPEEAHLAELLRELARRELAGLVPVLDLGQDARRAPTPWRCRGPRVRRR